MTLPSVDTVKIATIGLGYVGLPLALRLSDCFQVTGFDVDLARLAELQSGIDRTGECSSQALAASRLELTSDPERIAGFDIYIVTVPTPVAASKEPDLRAVMSACAIVGQAMAKGAVVVFESTVYPGVTESLCGPALEKASGLVCGTDFYLGYSPERINPGDKVHTIDKITKVVAGQTAAVSELLVAVYGRLTNGNVFLAKDIKTAEAAKVIENAQRDVNIAFINEVAMIFNQMGIQTQDVLETAATKWNFLNFKPGLVGGHCIGVDPYYLAYAATQLGHNPEVILAGRKINDDMAGFLARQIDRQIQNLSCISKPTRVLALGLTFKENVPDLRNSKAADFIMSLQKMDHQVDIHDPLADAGEARALYGFDLLTGLDDAVAYDSVIAVVPHAPYLSFDSDRLRKILKPGGLVADMKGIWRHITMPAGYVRWEL
ncbi:MAG: nucleotide sugar dehydrogenase [Rhodospirillales bacterium]|nr:nucleotide sugar dehydrogenase [Rhodospirillales bacterium]